MRARIGTLVVVVFVVASLVWGNAAQSNRGSLAGTIKDVSGAVLPGVTVEASGPMVASAVTDTRGAFRINNLIPGDYTVTATLPGFVVSRPSAPGRAHGPWHASPSRCASARSPRR